MLLVITTLIQRLEILRVWHWMRVVRCVWVCWDHFASRFAAQFGHSIRPVRLFFLNPPGGRHVSHFMQCFVTPPVPSGVSVWFVPLWFVGLRSAVITSPERQSRQEPKQ